MVSVPFAIASQEVRTLRLGTFIISNYEGAKDTKKDIAFYILSRTPIPNNESPSFRVLAVKSHSTNRDVRAGSSALRTGQFS